MFISPYPYTLYFPRFALRARSFKGVQAPHKPSPLPPCHLDWPQLVKKQHLASYPLAFKFCPPDGQQGRKVPQQARQSAVLRRRGSGRHLWAEREGVVALPLEGAARLGDIYILYYTILYYTILYYTILYYTILYYTTLHYTILYYTILYYTILYKYYNYYTILD